MRRRMKASTPRPQRPIRVDLTPPTPQPFVSLAMPGIATDPRRMNSGELDRRWHLEQNLQHIYRVRKESLASGQVQGIVISGETRREPIRTIVNSFQGEARIKLVADAIRARHMEPSTNLVCPREIARDLFNELLPGHGDSLTQPVPPGYFTAVIVAGGGSLIVRLPDE